MLAKVLLFNDLTCEEGNFRIYLFYPFSFFGNNFDHANFEYIGSFEMNRKDLIP